MDLRSESNPMIRHVYQAYSNAKGHWLGCNWHTRFGIQQRDLCGLRSHQVALLAEATTGAESGEWKEACEYLKHIENDAAKAECFAQASILAVREGHLQKAVDWIELALSLERKYRAPEVWTELANAIYALVSQTPGHALHSL